jgi:lipopolysaccharide biosynthesis glycosyltransferase
MTEAIQLVSAADSKFAPGLITALGSAVASASGRFDYHISVIDGGLTGNDWAQLESCLSRIGSLKGIPVSLARIPAAELSNSDMPMRRGSQLTYSRLSIPCFLKVPKLVYIDSDVLCLRGIEDFWTNSGHRILVAARDPLGTIGRDSFARRRLPFAKRGQPYFNAGIIGINCERWSMPENQLKIKELLPLADQFKYADQSLLNCAFHDEWQEIPEINNQVLCLRNCANLDKVDPAANFHYVGGRKPWLNSDSSAYRHSANLLFDKVHEWISGEAALGRVVKEQSLAEARKKLMLYRFLLRSRSREYAKILGSALQPEAVVDRLWMDWIARCGPASGTVQRA